MTESFGDTQPELSPFSYVLIPCADTTEASLHRFEGNADEQLRDQLRTYFASVGGSMNESQRQDLLRSLQARLESTKKKQDQEDAAAAAAKVVDVTDEEEKKVGQDGAISTTATTTASSPAEETKKQTEDLLAHAVANADDGNYEIVPVVLPSLKSKFRAVSLYIDGTGMIKDLPLNIRASKIASREIRGDAFLLTNHDDPALDTWQRVDTTMDDYKNMLESPPPPQGTNVTGDPLQQNAALAQREDMTKLVSAEDAKKALDEIAAGRAAFSAQEFAKASEHFQTCYCLLSARTDRLPNDEQLQQEKTKAYLNDAQCMLKLGKWADAEKLSAVALTRDASSEKAVFRLCTAKMHQNDFEGAFAFLDAMKQQRRGGQGDDQVPLSAEWQTLETEMKQARAKFDAVERKKYAGMFA